MNLLKAGLHCFQHLPECLADGGQKLGAMWLYAALFAVVFCETGLVVTPFLPGDSLLFALGALTGPAGKEVHFPLGVVECGVLLVAAAVIGDAVNYAIGKRIGPAVFKREDSRWLRKAHLQRAQDFYERHGGKAIILARFVPIVRTFAPFVAGVGKMRYSRFFLFNVTGAIAWVSLFLVAGYKFGEFPAVKRNFQLVIVAIIIISVMPIAIEFWRARRTGATTSK